MYRVLFATKSEGVPTMPWAPKEGDDFEVGKREAQRRMRELLEAGKKGEPVEGLVPYTVEIRDEAGEVCYAVTTDADDVPTGTWLQKSN